MEKVQTVDNFIANYLAHANPKLTLICAFVKTRKGSGFKYAYPKDGCAGFPELEGSTKIVNCKSSFLELIVKFEFS